MPPLVPVNLANLVLPQPRPGPAGLVVQRPVGRRQHVAAGAAGDGQQPLIWPEGSMCPGRGTRRGVLTTVFPPGLHPTPTKGNLFGRPLRQT